MDLPVTTPFPEDRQHASYDRDAVERYLRILEWTDGVLEEFAGWYCGKTSPVHLFWHGLDLAVTRFGGARAPASPGAGRVDQDAYSHEVVSFGFWVGDESVREPSYYSYTFPEPVDLRRQHLQPDAASWGEQRGGSLALLPYDAVRTADDPRNASSLPRERVPCRCRSSGLGPGRAHIRVASEPASAERDPRRSRGLGDTGRRRGVMDDPRI